MQLALARPRWPPTGMKTLSNYTNHLFDTPLDSVFKVREFSAFKAAQLIVAFFKPRHE
jgi:hypothetical protein